MVKLGDIAVITDRALAIACFERALQLYEGLGRTESVAGVHSRLGCALSCFQTCGIFRAHSSIFEKPKNS